MGLDEKTSALVLRQVEFYFSDSNLPGDKFLRQCVEEAADGLVSLPLICSFGRMRSHLKLMESGPDKVPKGTTEAVAEVLRKSTVLRVSDDGQKVGRVAPLLKLEEVQAAVDARSIAVGPLRWTITMEEVEGFFSQHAKVISVRLPRHPGGKAFCGSAVLELDSEEEVKKALDLKVSYDGIELEIKPKKDFDAEMEENRMQVRGDSNGQRFPKKEADLKFPKGLIVTFSLEKTSSVVGGEPEKKEVISEDSKEGEASKEVISEDSKEGEAPKEASVSASGEESVKEEDQISREDIKNAFKRFGSIKYVDYFRGAATGYLRFEKPEEVQKARAAAVLAEAGGIAVKNHIATLEAVEGDAEEDYWRNIQRSQDKVRAESGRGSRGRGGGGSRGRGGRSFDKSRRDRNFDGARGTEQKGKADDDAKVGKHQRFEDADSGDEAAPPSKQSKCEVADPIKA